MAPQAGQVLRLPASILAPVRRLHADACRLVEKKPELIALPAVAHALEAAGTGQCAPFRMYGGDNAKMEVSDD